MNKYLARNKFLIGFAAFVVIVVVVVFAMTQPRSQSSEMASSTPQKTTESPPVTKKPTTPTKQTSSGSTQSSTGASGGGTVVKDFKDGSYIVEGLPVKLSGGSATIGGAVYRIVGTEAVGDLNADYIPDLAFILSKTTDTATYHFVAAGMKNNNGYRGTNAILLGAGIQLKSQAVSIGAGEIVVNYDERKFGEPATAVPSIPVSKYFKVSNGTLVGTH